MLEDNEAKLLELSARLKPNSKTLSNLKIKIKNLKEFLKRPNQILLEFRELNRLAKRDETFLANIEESGHFETRTSKTIKSLAINN